MTGCVQQVLRPDINDATIRLLARRGVDVIVAQRGRLLRRAGQAHGPRGGGRAVKLAATSMRGRRRSGAGPDRRDHRQRIGLRHDGQGLRPHAAQRSRSTRIGAAKRVSSLAKDVSEFLYEYQLGAPERWSSLRVAYHSACSLQHGQRVHDEPKALLKQAGFAVVDVPEGHICCGSAGTYNILQPEIAGQLKKRKLENIRSTRADVVAAGNIGCITQLDLRPRHSVGAYGRASGLGVRRSRSARSRPFAGFRDRRAASAATSGRIHRDVIVTHGRHSSPCGGLAFSCCFFT